MTYNRLNLFKTKSFTLIELLIVIAIIAILATTIIIITTPGERLAQTRDATRATHLNSLKTILYTYQIDNSEGFELLGIGNIAKDICNLNSLQGEEECPEDLIDLTPLVNEGYIATIPIDPQVAQDNITTGYQVYYLDNRIKLYARKAETRQVGETDIFSVGLVSYWSLEENEDNTTVIDSHGDNDGTLEGGKNTEDVSVSGKVSNAFEFDGEGDYVRITHNDNLSMSLKFSIGLWVKKNETKSSNFIRKSNNYAIDVHGDKLRFFVYDEDSTLFLKGLTEEKTINFCDNTWRHVVMVNDGDYLYLYIDGEEVDKRSAPSKNLYTSDSILRFGDTTNNRFDGSIDEVGIWNRALSAEEISALYNNGDGLPYPF